MFVMLAFEDVLQERVLEKIFTAHGYRFEVTERLCRGGKGYLQKNAAALNMAARLRPIIMQTDQDRVVCAPTLIRDWLKTPRHDDFVLRVAAREVESRLLADKASFSKFLGVSVKRFNDSPDEILDPKTYITSLARKSNNRGIRQDIPPLPRTNAKIGIGYNSRLAAFVLHHWNPVEAARRSPSLASAVRAIGTLHERLRAKATTP